MMIRKLLILTGVIWLISVGTLFGQATEPTDKVLLRDGRTLIGSMVRKTGNKSIIFQAPDGELSEIPYTDIKSVTPYKPPRPRPEIGFTDSVSNSYYKNKGYLLIAEGGVGFPTGSISVYGRSAENNVMLTSINLVNAYQFSRYFSLGLGTGVDFYPNSQVAPITLDMRIAFSKAPTSVMFNLNGGMNLGNDGFVINPSMGVRSYFTRKNALLVNLGYKWQELPVSFYGTRKNALFNFVTLNGGFSF